jgi:hypothetical protein
MFAVAPNIEFVLSACRGWSDERCLWWLEIQNLFFFLPAAEATLIWSEMSVLVCLWWLQNPNTESVFSAFSRSNSDMIILFQFWLWLWTSVEAKNISNNFGCGCELLPPSQIISYFKNFRESKHIKFDQTYMIYFSQTWNSLTLPRFLKWLII